jgi:cellulose synthase/poly-beta-1,6-N-acetylglucosamine synthase-like glycosyltransferase
MNALVILLFVFMAASVYPLLGYPLVIALVGWVRPRPVRRAPVTPSVTILIPAYNEAGCIARTVANKLEQDYPAGLLQIIVASDASNDGTDDVVAQFASRGVQLLRQSERNGKAAGLNAAVRIARGEILVFSDANSMFAPDTVRRLVENFADPDVGYVTGRLTMQHGGDSAGAGNTLYLRYENLLRTLETRAGSAIGVNGGVDAVRRSLYVDVPTDQITDFVLPLSVIAAGHRVVYDNRASASEEANSELASEFRMRVRVALRAARGIWYMRAVLHPFRRPLSAFMIFSHKILRYLTFAFLVLTLIDNALLWAFDNAFRFLLLLQLCLYALGLLGLNRSLPRPLRLATTIPTYYLMSNVAFAVAAARLLRGETMATWAPRAG